MLACSVPRITDITGQDEDDEDDEEEAPELVKSSGKRQASAATKSKKVGRLPSPRLFFVQNTVSGGGGF